MATIEGTSLGKSSVLRRASDISLRLRGSEITVRGPNGEIVCEPVVLALLDAFFHPQTIEEALGLLEQRTPTRHEWVELSALILQLAEIGALEASTGRPKVRATAGGFEAAAIHIRMLEDHRRTSAYVEAIRKTVQPGDVVVDLGTGTGVLAVAAAQAGARQVYAIEATGIGETALALIESNECADRVTVVRGWSTQVELPEKGDVLVSEIVGDEPLGERILEFTSDALARHLEPAPRLVPRSLGIWAVPVSVPDEELAKHRFQSAPVSRWAEWYGVDFDSLLEAETSRPYQFVIKPHRAAAWPTLGEAIHLVEVDLAAPPQEIDESRQGRAEVEAQLDAFVVFFELELAEDLRLSSRPGEAEESCSWHCQVWLLPRPVPVSEGQELAVRYRHSAVRTVLDYVDPSQSPQAERRRQ